MKFYQFNPKDWKFNSELDKSVQRKNLSDLSKTQIRAWDNSLVYKIPSISRACLVCFQELDLFNWNKNNSINDFFTSTIIYNKNTQEPIAIHKRCLKKIDYKKYSLKEES